ncbi:MAG: hypothetical protein KF884_08155 [Fimbriimonadaceae bacterium]|nr:hypothetical protein [Fimbriimonadaceae bacterium]QYK57522.1 MAG: hypothetical protein KF884_08155 [Fimbriimonadaceae bacterium]
MRRLAGWGLVAAGGLLAFFGGGPFGWLVGAGVGLAGLLMVLRPVAAGDAGLPDPEEIGAEGRSFLRPLREAAEALKGMARSHGADPGVSLIAAEAAAEADSVLESAARLVTLRQRFKRALKGQGESETAIGRLERQLADAPAAERPGLERALEARKSELTHYERARAAISEIDGKLRHAEAELSELKARLLAGSVLAQADRLDETEFQETVARLKSLGRSFEEVQELVEQRR